MINNKNNNKWLNNKIWIEVKRGRGKNREGKKDFLWFKRGKNSCVPPFSPHPPPPVSPGGSAQLWEAQLKFGGAQAEFEQAQPHFRENNPSLGRLSPNLGWLSSVLGVEPGLGVLSLGLEGLIWVWGAEPGFGGAQFGFRGVNLSLGCWAWLWGLLSPSLGQLSPSLGVWAWL